MPNRESICPFVRYGEPTTPGGAITDLLQEEINLKNAAFHVLIEHGLYDQFEQYFLGTLKRK